MYTLFQNISLIKKYIPINLYSSINNINTYVSVNEYIILCYFRIFTKDKWAKIIIHPICLTLEKTRKKYYILDYIKINYKIVKNIILLYR